MFGDDSWFVAPADKYGGAFLQAHAQASPAAAGGMSELTTVAGAPTATRLGHLGPGSGMFALLVLGAVSFGLMAVSTTVRVGGATASASVGKKGG